MGDKLNQQELREQRILRREARRWLVDASIYTEAEASAVMDHVLIVAAINRHYEGGWDAFTRDNVALLS